MANDVVPGWVMLVVVGAFVVLATVMWAKWAKSKK